MDVIELSDDDCPPTEAMRLPALPTVVLTTPVVAPPLWSVGGPASRLLVPVEEATSRSEFGLVSKRWVDGGLRREGIRSVHRIQNGHLYSTYVTYRAALAAAARRREHAGVKAEPTGAASEGGDDAELANEDALWHGADVGAIRTIIQQGFDMRVSNQSGALGAGNYFAWSAAYSLAYSNMGKHSLGGSSSGLPELAVAQDERVMLLARVALGRPGPSNAQCRVPVFGFDSAAQGPICCVFDNAACYPEYVVVFRPAEAKP